MDTTREMIEWISQQEYFTYVQFSRRFDIPYNQVKRIFIEKLKKYYYKLRRNCLVYHRVTKIEKVNIEVGSYTLVYKIYSSKEFFYIPKDIVSIYGMPVIGSYFSPLHFLTIKGYRIDLSYVISFLTRKKFYTIFKLSDDLENWEKKYNWKTVVKKFNAKYKFKNNVTVIRAINLLKGK